MNRQEVAGVLAYFGAAFPNMDISHDTADVWANELADIDPDLAPTAMRNVVKASEFPPTIAKFREACAVVAHHQRMKESTARALEPAPVTSSPDFDFHAAADELRTQFKGWSARGHNHKGPEPCAVCAQRLASERGESV